MTPRGGLLGRIEESVLRIATCSSTKNHLAKSGSSRKNKSRCRNTRGRKKSESDLSDSQQLNELRKTQPVATLENGVGTSRIPKDIS